MQLAATYRDRGYDDAATQFAFALEDPCFNALLIASEHALASVAKALSLDPAPHLQAAAELTAALVKEPVCRRHLPVARPGRRRTGCRRHHRGLIPLLVDGLPVATELLATAQGPRFRLGEVRMVPSYDLTGPAFEPGRYWRGPSWFNTAWLIHRGLVGLGQAELADALRTEVLELAAATDFAEYVDPYTGEARGARDFSWTAALALDLERAQL